MGNYTKIGLLDSVVTSYDQTKTSLFGGVFQKTIEGEDIIGPPMSSFFDTFADTGYVPLGPIWCSRVGTGPRANICRVYVPVGTFVTAGAQVALYDFNIVTGVRQYRGKIAFYLPGVTLNVCTHVLRGIRVYNDSTDDTANWRMFFVTQASVAPFSGLYCINKIDNNDFLPSNIGTLPAAASIISFATGTDQKGIYAMQNPDAMGSLHALNAPAAIAFEVDARKIWVHNGLSATHQYASYNAAVASLVCTNYAVTVRAAATVSVEFGSAHGLKHGDVVQFVAGTMPNANVNLFTHYTVYLTGLADPVTKCSLAAITAGGPGGAQLVSSPGVDTTATLCRVYGQTGSGFLNHTPILPPLTGILLLSDSENNAVPTSCPLNATLNGQSCLSFGTASNLYLGKVSELASQSSFHIVGAAATVGTAQQPAISLAAPAVVTHPGHPFLAGGNDPVMFSSFLCTPSAGLTWLTTPPTNLVIGTVYYVKYVDANTYQLTTTPGGAVGITTLLNNVNACTMHRAGLGDIKWASLTTANLLGSLNQLTAPAAVTLGWDSTTDGFVYNTNVSKFVSKQLVNNSIRALFGSVDNTYYEGLVDPRITFGMATVGGLARRDGWLMITGSTVGQRGIQAIDMRADYTYDYSYIVTRVIDAPGQTLEQVSSYTKYYDYTGDNYIYYKTSGFADPATGWSGPIDREEMNAVVISEQVQLKIMFTVQSEGFDSPVQLHEVFMLTNAQYDMSAQWEYSHNNSNTLSPTRCGFRLKSAYASVVPTLYFRAYDLLGNLLTNLNTSSNPTYFEYSTDSGIAWLPLPATIPNVVGTLVRFTFTSPPGVDVRPSLFES